LSSLFPFCRPFPSPLCRSLSGALARGFPFCGRPPGSLLVTPLFLRPPLLLFEFPCTGAHSAIPLLRPSLSRPFPHVCPAGRPMAVSFSGSSPGLAHGSGVRAFSGFKDTRASPACALREPMSTPLYCGIRQTERRPLRRLHLAERMLLILP